jgi:hypothetical protein
MGSSNSSKSSNDISPIGVAKSTLVRFGVDLGLLRFAGDEAALMDCSQVVRFADDGHSPKKLAR